MLTPPYDLSSSSDIACPNALFLPFLLCRWCVFIFLLTSASTGLIAEVLRFAHTESTINTLLRECCGATLKKVGGAIFLKKDNGETITILFKNLVEADQEYIAKLRNAQQQGDQPDTK